MRQKPFSVITATAMGVATAITFAVTVEGFTGWIMLAAVVVVTASLWSQRHHVIQRTRESRLLSTVPRQRRRTGDDPQFLNEDRD